MPRAPLSLSSAHRSTWTGGNYVTQLVNKHTLTAWVDQLVSDWLVPAPLILRSVIPWAVCRPSLLWPASPEMSPLPRCLLSLSTNAPPITHAQPSVERMKRVLETISTSINLLRLLSNFRGSILFWS